MGSMASVSNGLPVKVVLVDLYIAWYTQSVFDFGRDRVLYEAIVEVQHKPEPC